MYQYKATVTRIIDGDTIQATVDIGFRVSMTLRFRLYGMDSPERGQPGYNEATAHLKLLIGEGQAILNTYKDPDSFGRWLCVITKDGVNLNEQMVADGHAIVRRAVINLKKV